MSPVFLVTVMAQEDHQLPDRWTAVDPNAFFDRVAAHMEGKEDSSGSTIPQQVVKNIFLWPEQSAFRKLFEAPLAEEAALLLTNRRLLELYVNYAQFAPQVYGVCAASWYYFDHSSSTLSPEESAELVGLLPSPLHVHRAPGGGLAFDDDLNGNGVADESEPGFISAKGVWHARKHAEGWVRQMGGVVGTGRSSALERLGIQGPDAPPPGADLCRERPDGLDGLAD